MTDPHTERALHLVRDDRDFWRELALREIGRRVFYQGLFDVAQRQGEQQQRTIARQRQEIQALRDELTARMGVVKCETR